jgi:hypothetical protein
MWQGVSLSVQPRIRLTRSFDRRSHTYLGYSLKVRGRVGSSFGSCACWRCCAPTMCSPGSGRRWSAA